MAQEFFINSETLQRKVAEILPSQGGAGAGFDLSASTQIVPIVDLTESIFSLTDYIVYIKCWLFRIHKAISRQEPCLLR